MPENIAVYSLIQSSLPEEYDSLTWVSHFEFTNIKLVQDTTDQIIHCKRGLCKIMLLLLGNDEKCTSELISEFARKYSLPTRKCKLDTLPNRFRRYARWLSCRNRMIKGFTKLDNNYYMVADRKFEDCYSLYGFCSACGILRCSPVWCICGHKQLSNGWTSNNKKLDEFIKKSQIRTNSANEAYLEWIPFDCLSCGEPWSYLNGLPAFCYARVVPLEITDEIDDSYFDQVIIPL